MKSAVFFIVLLNLFTMSVVADDVNKWIQDLNDPIPAIREAAVEALIEPAVRGVSVKVLIELNDTRALEPFIQALMDEDPWVRVNIR